MEPDFVAFLFAASYKGLHTCTWQAEEGRRQFVSGLTETEFLYDIGRGQDTEFDPKAKRDRFFTQVRHGRWCTSLVYKQLLVPYEPPTAFALVRPSRKT